VLQAALQGQDGGSTQVQDDVGVKQGKKRGLASWLKG
jgi:hypothetical protein